MIIWLSIWTTLNAGGAAVNAALYVAQHQPISIAAAIFCGLMFVVSLGWLIAEVRR